MVRGGDQVGSCLIGCVLAERQRLGSSERGGVRDALELALRYRNSAYVDDQAQEKDQRGQHEHEEDERLPVLSTEPQLHSIASVALLLNVPLWERKPSSGKLMLQS